MDVYGDKMRSISHRNFKEIQIFQNSKVAQVGDLERIKSILED